MHAWKGSTMSPCHTSISLQSPESWGLGCHSIGELASHQRFLGSNLAIEGRTLTDWLAQHWTDWLALFAALSDGWWNSIRTPAVPAGY